MKTDELGKIRPQEGRGGEKKDQGWKQGGAEAPGEVGQLLFRFDLVRKAQASRSAVGHSKAGDSETDSFFFFFESIHQSKRTLKQTFLCPSPTTVGQGLPSPHFPTVCPTKSYRTQGSTQNLWSLSSCEIPCSGLSDTAATHLSPGESAVTLSSSQGIDGPRICSGM